MKRFYDYLVLCFVFMVIAVPCQAGQSLLEEMQDSLKVSRAIVFEMDRAVTAGRNVRPGMSRRPS